MNFLNLPVELGVIIFNYLDTPTKIIVYNSCAQVREYFASGFCHLENVNLSRSTLATVKTLNDKLFVNLGEHIRDLNLSGVQDLTVDNLQPHISRFVNLKSLDITFTQIYLSDIANICPKNVKHIGINFFKYPNTLNTESINIQCRQVFKDKQFESVHFVVFEFEHSASPLLFLKEVPPINSLKISLFDNILNLHDDCSSSNKIEINFNKLFFISPSDMVTHKMLRHLKGVAWLDFNQLEYIFIMYLDKIEIYVSPLFSNIFTVNCNDLKVKVSSCIPQTFMLNGNVVFKAWNKKTTIFDEPFFTKLLVDFKDYFPTYVCLRGGTKMKITKSPSSWYCIDCCENFKKMLEDLPENITLTDYCRRDGLPKRCHLPISLSKGSETLHRVTFLSIHTIPLRKDFFTNLFNNCPKLVTLCITVYDDMVRSYTQSLSKAIYLAKIRNFMLTSYDIDYETIFQILSQCLTLENIHICEVERPSFDHVSVNNILSCIKKCVNLYSLFIESDMPGECLTMMMSPLRVSAQVLERDSLCIEVCSIYCCYNPFVDVFNPSPLNIIN